MREVGGQEMGSAMIRPESVGGRLKVLMTGLPPERVTLVEIRDLLAEDGLMLLNALLAITFLIPLSIPGLSTVFGAAIMMIAASRLLGRPMWLPKRVLKQQLPAEKLLVALNRGLVWVHRLESISRPQRLAWLACGRYPGIVNNCALFLAAGLLMAPFGLIPFSNALPALAVLFFTLGFLQRDGLCMLAGHGVNIVTIAYFALLLGGGGAVLMEMVQRFTAAS